MTDRPSTQLDLFEAALLAELKATLPQSTSTPARTPARLQLPRRRWQISAVVGVVALAVAVLVSGLGPTPAYAVTGRNNGEIHVTVNRLEGADGLEQALADHGISADITYLPEGKECAAGRYHEVDTPGLTVSVGAKRFEVTIPPGAVEDGDTFVLDASVVPLPNGLRARVSFGIGNGFIAPCQPIDVQ